MTLLMLWAAAATVCAADKAVSAVDRQVAEVHANRAHEQLQERFISEFSEFAGSADNALSLYSGLRTGSRITLSMPVANSDAGTAVVQFNPVAGPMGYGSAFIGMALAKRQLVNFGISRPTPWQVQAVLNGGAIIPGRAGTRPVALKGVLAQRADGLGWSVIAKVSGISLGKVLDGLRNPHTDVAALGGSNAYPDAWAVKRGSRYAMVHDAPGTMRTAVSPPMQHSGVIAQ
jgi:hypothetical protein